MMMVEEDQVLFVGDLMFTGRIPFVADADVSAWITALDRVIALKPKVVVPGHGPYSTDAVTDLAQTRDYLVYLRTQISAGLRAGPRLRRGLPPDRLVAVRGAARIRGCQSAQTPTRPI